MERDGPSMNSQKTLTISVSYGSRLARDNGVGASVFVHSESPDRARILGNPRSRVARDMAKASSTNSSNSPRTFE